MSCTPSNFGGVLDIRGKLVDRSFDRSPRRVATAIAANHNRSWLKRTCTHSCWFGGIDLLLRPEDRSRRARKRGPRTAFRTSRARSRIYQVRTACCA